MSDSAKKTSLNFTPSAELAAREAKRLQQRERAKTIFMAVCPPFFGMALLVLIWSIVSIKSTDIPSPWLTWQAAVKLFSDPFYSKRPWVSV